MVRSQTRWWLLGGVGGLFGLLWLGSILLHQDKPSTKIVQEPLKSHSPAASPSDESQFVGSAVCATCHSDISEAFHHHPMGRSLDNAREAPEIENFKVTEFAPPGARRYRIERTADAVRHHEVLLDEDGSEIYDQVADVRYALGSGKRGRAYLIEHDGMIFKSSLAWFSPHQEWGLSPGYPPGQHKRFERRITEGCINCHVGRMSAKPSAPDIFLPPVVIEAAISCERCHGPGREHAAAHEAGTVTDKQHIIHPARLDHAQRDAICAQCHLHGKATVLRTGQRVFDFRPGQRIEDNRIVFVAPPSTANGSAANALSQVELMATSVCFQKSNGRMGCTSCHDPHSMPTAETRVDYYRAKCLACHDNDNRNCRVPVAERQQQEPTDSCIACHMPPALHGGIVLRVVQRTAKYPMIGKRNVQDVADMQGRGHVTCDTGIGWLFRLSFGGEHAAIGAVLSVTVQTFGSVVIDPCFGGRHRVRVVARRASHAAVALLKADAGGHQFDLAERVGG